MHGGNDLTCCYSQTNLCRYFLASRAETEETICVLKYQRNISGEATKIDNKGILCEVPFVGGSALLLFYGVRAKASCNYTPHYNVQ